MSKRVGTIVHKVVKGTKREIELQARKGVMEQTFTQQTEYRIKYVRVIPGYMKTNSMPKLIY